MGYNTVVVVYNDMMGHSTRSLARMDEAIRNWHGRREGDHLTTYFGLGQVLSCEHADYEQVVVVGRNTGQRIRDAKDLSAIALEDMAKCLERHGYKVSPPARPQRRDAHGSAGTTS